MILPRATFLISNGNNIVAYNFARFAANDVKDRQVATGNGASCLWQQHDLNVKTWLPNFWCAYSNSSDNRINSSFHSQRFSHCITTCGPRLSADEGLGLKRLIIVNRGKWLERLVNIKKATVLTLKLSFKMELRSCCQRDDYPYFEARHSSFLRWQKLKQLPWVGLSTRCSTTFWQLQLFSLSAFCILSNF